jgi:predicted O-methyltransferase YrrM
MNYTFTNDWFSISIPIWQQVLEKYKGQPCTALEIGCYEGRSSAYLLDHILTHPQSHLTCVDPHAHNFFFQKEIIEAAQQNFVNNILVNHGNKVSYYRDTSTNVLKKQELLSQTFDIIYIDGDHAAASILEDAVLAFPLLKVGGILIFDDYGGGDGTLENPKLAVDSFLQCYSKYVHVMYTGYQLILTKTESKN